MVASPTEIRKMSGGAGMKMTWSDGHTFEYPAFMLRDNCHCAACRHELTGEKLLRTDSIPKDVVIQKAEIIGEYALGFQFSDGHSTGIYTFDFLQSLGQP